jgi:hypothetical protein
MAFLGKIFIMIVGKFSIEKLLTIVFKYGFGKLKELAGSVGLNKKTIMLVQILYLISTTLGKEWVNETSTPVDNEINDGVTAIAVELAKINAFPLPKL